MRLKEIYWDNLFKIGLFLKGLNGLWETIAGSILLLLSQARLDSLFLRLVRGELLEDPHDRLVNFLALKLQHLSVGAQTFAGIYILIHGLLNLFLVINLYRDRIWAFKVSMVAVSALALYQLYRFNHTHSTILMAVTIFDIFYLSLTWHEYRYHHGKKVG